MEPNNKVKNEPLNSKKQLASPILFWVVDIGKHQLVDRFIYYNSPF